MVWASDARVTGFEPRWRRSSVPAVYFESHASRSHVRSRHATVVAGVSKREAFANYATAVRSEATYGRGGIRTGARRSASLRSAAATGRVRIPRLAVAHVRSRHATDVVGVSKREAFASYATAVRSEATYGRGGIRTGARRSARFARCCVLQGSNPTSRGRSRPFATRNGRGGIRTTVGRARFAARDLPDSNPTPLTRLTVVRR